MPQYEAQMIKLLNAGHVDQQLQFIFKTSSFEKWPPEGPCVAAGSLTSLAWGWVHPLSCNRAGMCVDASSEPKGCRSHGDSQLGQHYLYQIMQLDSNRVLTCGLAVKDRYLKGLPENIFISSPIWNGLCHFRRKFCRHTPQPITMLETCKRAASSEPSPCLMHPKTWMHLIVVLGCFWL